MTDVLILGLGPAGRALAHRGAARGLDILAVDPHPHRTWTPTYAAWADELPTWLPPAATAATVDRPSVFTHTRTTIDRPYSVLDTPALQASLRLEPDRVRTGRITAATQHTAELADGTVVRADHVIDARGTHLAPGEPEQAAFGVVVAADVAASVLDGADAWFMDWRDNVSGTSPTFLYAVPLGDGTVLLEETCLVGSPALGLDVLRERLHARLRTRGVTLDGTERVERVRFPVTAPRRRRSEPTGFGSRGRLMHPGTGYSVATSLRAADDLLDALDQGRSTFWTPRARAVHALRTAGLRTLLGLSPDQVVPFFAAFFELPVQAQRAYLSERSDLRGTATTMTKLFGRMPADVRRVAVTATISPRVHSPYRRNSTKMGQ